MFKRWRKEHFRERWPDRPEPMDAVEEGLIYYTEPTAFEIVIGLLFLAVANVVLSVVMMWRKRSRTRDRL